VRKPTDTFVAQAAYPLVLDPLVGPTISITGTDDVAPDVAFDQTNDLYLVVWQREFSGFEADVFCQRISSSGALVGGLIPITSLAGVETNPRVANVDQTNKFLVAWQQGGGFFPPFDIAASTVDAGTGAVSPATVVAGTGANEFTPDVGGNPRIPFPPFFFAPPDALVVWEQDGAGIKGRIVRCPASGAPTLPGSLLDVTTNANDSRPAVSKSCGGPGRWLVVWQRFITTVVPNKSDIYASVLTTTGTFPTGTVFVTSGLSADNQNPDCAGNGTNFMIVWQRDAFLAFGDANIWGAVANYTTLGGPGPVLLFPSSGVLEGTVGQNEREPAIDFAGSKYIVAWNEEVTPANYDMWMVSVAPDSCAACEPKVALDTSPTDDFLPNVGAQASAATALTGDQAMVVWQAVTIIGATGDVKAQRVEAIGAGGAMVDLGGGCGGGGIAGTNGPVAVGNSAFALTLAGADAGATGSLVNVSPPVAPFSCGPCMLIPPFLTFFEPVSGGAAALPLAIPCDLGLLGGTVHVQWAAFPTAASPCPSFPAVSFSNRLALTVGS
jgi:hypothetical protein